MDSWLDHTDVALPGQAFPPHDACSEGPAETDAPPFRRAASAPTAETDRRADTSPFDRGRYASF